MPRLLWLLLLSSLIVPKVARAEIRPEFLMDKDPELRVPEPLKVWSPRFKQLWLEALSRPEQDMQRMAADTIAKAHEVGLPGMEEAVPVLTKLLTADGSLPATRFAAARALMALKATHAAPSLFEAAQHHDAELRQLIEPALAEWDFQPIRSVWLDRLENRSTRPRETVLAIRGLARVNEIKALVGVRKLVLDKLQRPDIRLESATAAGRLADQGLEPDVTRLTNTAQGSSVVDRVCAVRLLARHSNDASQTLLIKMAGDAEPSVASAALARLNEIDPSLVLPLAESALSHPDPHVRQQGAASYIQRPTPERMPSLARLLDDPHPQVRGEIREALFRLEQTAELSQPIRVAAMQELSRDGWRGQEQAALLLAALDHKPAAGRLVELLESKRPEVMIATAWGLRRLEVLETLPAMLDKATRQTDLRPTGEPNALDAQVGHLFEGFGRMKYSPAEPLLLKYVPKPGLTDKSMGTFSRGTAIWVLGWLHEGTPDTSLAEKLIGRVIDPGTFPPEIEMVRQTSAVALARMKAVSQAETLRAYTKQKSPHEQTGLVLRWALTELAGDTFPPVPLITTSPGVWFLEPFDPPAKSN
ncbi:MAG: HEAT repeat domain-containing protein [Planctomycetota bacterium]